MENSIPLQGPSKKVSHYIQYIVYITYQLLCKAFVSKFLFAFSKTYSRWSWTFFDPPKVPFSGPGLLVFLKFWHYLKIKSTWPKFYFMWLISILGVTYLYLVEYLLKTHVWHKTQVLVGVLAHMTKVEVILVRPCILVRVVDRWTSRNSN